MRKYIYLFLVLFLSVISPGKAQTVPSNELTDLIKQTQQNSYYDSVSVFSVGNKALALAKKDKNIAAQAEINIYYGNYHYYSQQFKQAEIYFKKALALAKSIKNMHFQFLANIRRAYILSEQGNVEEANKQFNQIIDSATQLKDYTNIIEAINGLAISMEIHNKPQIATQLYLKGLRIAEKNNLFYFRAVMLNNLGLVKLNNGQVDESLIDFREALETAKKENNLRLTFHTLNNVGLVLSEQGKEAEAIKEFRTTLMYAHIINHPRELATAYANIGSSLNKIKKTREAILYYDSAIYVMRQNDMRYELTKGLLGKATILIETNDLVPAEKNIANALLLAVSNGDLQIVAYSHMLMHRVRKKQKNYESALSEFVLYKELLDSLQGIRNEKQIKELQIQYDVEKKDNALKNEKTKSLILEKENQLKKVRIRVIIGIGVSLLLIIGIFFYVRNIRNIKRQQEKFSQVLITNTEQERSRIARDLHDDIGQSLSVIKSKINLEAERGKKEWVELEGDVGKIIEQTREISRNLYPSYLEKIGLVRSMARLMEKIQAASKIECSFDIAEEVEQISLENRTHIYRIIQECVNNTIKHSGASALKVSIEKKGDNFILSYLDNGRGISKTTESKGIGFMSMNERARMLDGEMQVGDNNGKGFKLIIKFNG